MVVLHLISPALQLWVWPHASPWAYVVEMRVVVRIFVSSLRPPPSESLPDDSDLDPDWVTSSESEDGARTIASSRPETIDVDD